MMSAPRRRVSKLRQLAEHQGISGFVISTTPNLRYYAGLSVIAAERFVGTVIPLDSEPVTIVPELERESLKDQRLPFMNILTYTDAEGPRVALERALRGADLARGTLGIEGFLPYKFFVAISRAVPKAKLKDTSSILLDLRLVKTRDEREIMRAAAEAVRKGIDAGIEAVKVGATELEVSFEIEREIKELGCEAVPYCLVLTGKNSVYVHGITSRTRIQKGDALIIDVAATREGYFADLTRTIFVGSATATQRKVYETVHKAQEKAIRSVRPGIPACKVDRAARGIIEHAGYGKYFVHRTGHGLGLEVHEDPSLAEHCTTMLRAGMTFTVEPGIYLPHKYGVRIEDDIAVTGSGNIPLGQCPKDLLIV